MGRKVYATSVWGSQTTIIRSKAKIAEYEEPRKNAQIGSVFGPDWRCLVCVSADLEMVASLMQGIVSSSGGSRC